MRLKSCKNARQCIYWMDCKLPGFWDFATKKPLTQHQIDELVRGLNKNWDAFSDMYEQLDTLEKSTHWSEEDSHYLSLLNHAFSPIKVSNRLRKLIMFRGYRT